MKEQQMDSYFKFHFENLGYKFKEVATGKILTKLQIYSRFESNQDVLKLLCNNKHTHYEKIDSFGWEKGQRIFCSSKNCEKRFECYRYKNKKFGNLIQNLGNFIECNMFEFTRNIN